VDGYNRDELDTLACLQHMAEFVEVRTSTLSSERSKLACIDMQWCTLPGKLVLFTPFG
jgi:hypothetical protein